MKSTRQVNRAFWRDLFGGKPRKYHGLTQNQLPADVRMSYCDYIEHLNRSGEISDNLANRATLY